MRPASARSVKRFATQTHRSVTPALIRDRRPERTLSMADADPLAAEPSAAEPVEEAEDESTDRPSQLIPLGDPAPAPQAPAPPDVTDPEPEEPPPVPAEPEPPVTTTVDIRATMLPGGEVVAPTEALATGEDPLVSSIMSAKTFEELSKALEPLNSWDHKAEEAAGIQRAKTYVQGSDKEVLGGFYVSSINEWKISQPRLLVLSRTAYYRVTYSHKHGRIDHYHKTALNKLRVFERTPTGLKIFLTEQDGGTSIGKKLGGWFGSKKEKVTSPQILRQIHLWDTRPGCPILSLCVHAWQLGSAEPPTRFRPIPCHPPAPRCTPCTPCSPVVPTRLTTCAACVCCCCTG